MILNKRHYQELFYVACLIAGAIFALAVITEIRYRDLKANYIQLKQQNQELKRSLAPPTN